MKRIFKTTLSIVLTLAVIMSTLILAPVAVSAETGYDRGYKGGVAGDDKGILGHGIDISTWQGTNIDFNAMKKDGVDFIILRAGYGTSTKDDCFEANYKAAKAAGIGLGVYWYSYALSASAVLTEAKYCASVIKGKTFEYPIYFDFEDADALALPSSTQRSMLNTWNEYFESQGYLPGVYSNAWVFEGLGYTDFMKKYETWMAGYYYSYDYSNYQNYDYKYGMWQYSDRGSHKGYSGNLDMDVVFKDYPTIVKQYGFNNYVVDTTFTFHFYPNGGEGTMEDQKVEFGVSTNINKNQYTREGYEFVGWRAYQEATGRWRYTNGTESGWYAKADKPVGYRYSIYKDGASVSKTGKGIGDTVRMYAVWSKQDYTVKYMANGGEGTMADSNFTYGVYANLSPNTFTREGYTFAGWHIYRPDVGQYIYDNGSETTGYVPGEQPAGYYLAMYEDQQMVSSIVSKEGTEVHAIAQWEPVSTGTQTYYVHYDANGGEGTMGVTPVVYGTSTPTETNKFTRENYTFGGWHAYRNSDKKWVFEDSAGTDKWMTWDEYLATESGTYALKVYGDGQSVSKTSKTDGDIVTFYAIWNFVEHFYFRYNANGGKGTMPDQKIISGESTPIAENQFTREGYTFAGWYAYREATGQWRYTDGTSNKFYLPGEQPEGYYYYIYRSGQNVSGTGQGTGDVVMMYAVWTKQDYTITYDANGGEGTMADSTHTYGKQSAISANAFTKSGNTFAGWNVYLPESGECLYTNGTNTALYKEGEQPAFYKLAVLSDRAVVEDICSEQTKVTLKAQWKPNSTGTTTYYLDYQPNGGEGTMARTAVVYGTATKFAANEFTRDGYTFKGWYLHRGKDDKWLCLDNEGNKVWATYDDFYAADSTVASLCLYEDQTEVSKNTSQDCDIVTLYAVWEADNYTVTFNSAGGSDVKAVVVEAGAKVSKPAEPTRDGYTFTGWFTDAKLTTAYDFNEAVTKNITLYAGWQEIAAEKMYIRGTFNNWTINNEMTPQGDGIYTAVLTLDAGTYEYKAATETYSKEWPLGANQSITLDRKSVVTFTLDTVNHRLSVTYTVVPYELTVKFVDYDGTVLSTQIVKEGEAAVAPTAPSRAGYTFTGWDKAYDCITADTTVTALYSKIVEAPTEGTLKIQVLGGTGFTLSVNDGASRPQSTFYLNSKTPIGTKVTVTATDTANKTFVGWVNSFNFQILTTNTAYTFYTGGNDFVKAIYKTDVDGANQVMYKNDKSNQILDMQYYMPGDEITTPDDPSYVGYDFAGWELSVDEIKALINAAKDAEVNPVWTVKLVYVTVSVNGGEITGHGGMNESGQYLANRGMIATADAAASGKKFAYWVDGAGKIKSYEEEYKFWPATDTELTAVYVAENQSIDYNTFVYMDSCDTSGTYGTFNFSWFVPESKGYTFMASGLVAVNKDFYNENTFYHGTTDTNVWDRSAANATASGVYNWTGPVMSGQTWVAKAWVQYKDAEGNVQTVYSTLLEVVKY